MRDTDTTVLCQCGMRRGYTTTCSEGKLRSSELDLLDDAVEVLALDLGELELERGRLARAVGARERAGAPRGACAESVV